MSTKININDGEYNKVIISPHPDDELIGCFREIVNDEIDQVVYVSDDGSQERRENAYKVGKHFEFETLFFEDEREFFREFSNLDEYSEETDFYVPNINDQHQLHKKVNRFMKQNFDWDQLNFYTIDKNVDREFIGNRLAEHKEKSLNEFYPTQSKLWETNDKYVLFEGVTSTDDKRFIEVNTDFRGFHEWSEAPEPVEFLKNQHRHTFEVNVKIEVNHDDRELEFFMFQRELDRIIENKLGLGNKNSHGEIELGGMSCEMIADEIAKGIMVEHEDREFSISVSEDGEVGAKVKYNGMR